VLGDHVVVRRAGEVIPRVEGAVTTLRTGAEQPVDLPDGCPRCGSDIDRSQERRRCAGRPGGVAEPPSEPAPDCESDISPIVCTHGVPGGQVGAGRRSASDLEGGVVTSGSFTALGDGTRSLLGPMSGRPVAEEGSPRG